MAKVLAAIEQVDPAPNPVPVSDLGELLAFRDIDVVDVFAMPLDEVVRLLSARFFFCPVHEHRIASKS
jgi:hypothetical protein